MRSRHWDELASELKFRLKLEDMTLTRIIEMDLLSHADVIRRVGSFACVSVALPLPPLCSPWLGGILTYTVPIV